MKIADAMVCVALATFSIHFCPWIPFIGPFISLLTPLVFLYYSVKLGLVEGIKLVGLSIIAVAVLAGLRGNYLSVFMAVEFGLLGLALSEFLRKGFTIGQTVFSGTALLVFLSLGLLFFLAVSKNLGPLEMVDQYLQEQLKGSMQVYKNMGVPDENAVQFESYSKALVSLLSKVYPSLIFVTIGFAVWLNLVLAKPLLRRIGLKYPGLTGLDKWKAPDPLIWVVIVCGFALFLFSGTVKFFALNVFIVAIAAYFFHGLAILLFFLNKYNAPVWLRGGAYLLILLQQIFALLLAMAGLFDQWIDFRKINKRAES